MKKIIYMLVLMLLSCEINAQRIEPSKIELEYQKEGGYQVKANLMKGDSVIWSRNVEYGSNEWLIPDDLPAGNYSLIVKEHGEVKAMFNDISIRDNCNVTYIYTMERDVNCDEVAIDSLSEKQDVIFGFTYGNQLMAPEPAKVDNESYNISMSGNYFFNTKRYCSQALTWGLNAGYTSFSNDSTLYEGNNIISKRYTSLGLTIGLINRFSFFNFKKYDFGNNGVKLDLGVIYNFPLIFREVQRLDNNSRMQTRFIHNYKDVYGMVRLSYKFFALHAEYNPVNYIIKGYSPNPPLRFGISIVVPVE